MNGAIAVLVFFVELFGLGLLVCLLAACLFVVVAWIENNDMAGRRPW